MDDRRHLRILLSERAALLHGGHRLAVRMAAGSSGRQAETLERVAHVLDDDVRTLVSLLRQVGAARPRLRMAAAAAAERAGHLKLNGRLRARSPLSDLQEMDGLHALLAAAAATWDAIDAAGVADPEVVTDRADGYRRLDAALTDHRRAAARRALGAPA